jgi:hypothetical protein
VTDNRAAEIIRLHESGMIEGEIVRRLGLTRHAVRTAIVFEEGRKAGLEQAREEYEAAAREQHYQPGDNLRWQQEHGGTLVPSQHGGSRFDEELLAELVSHIRAGRVPEKELRAKFGVSHNAMYMYRAVAADRIQCGRT